MESPRRTASQRRTTAIAIALLAALGALLWWSLQEPPRPAGTSSHADREDRPGVASAADDGTDGTAATLEPPREARTEAQPASKARELRCQLVGLHADAPWTTLVKIDLEGKVEARDQWEDVTLTAMPSPTGAFVVELPRWVDECVSFEIRFRSDDPLYLELEEREKARTAAECNILAADPVTLRVQVVAVITGRVVDADDRPVAAARVAAFPWRRGDPQSNPHAQTNSAADGSFHLMAPMAEELLVIAVPMHEASLSGMRMMMRHGAIADSNELRDDLVPASALAAVRFGGVHDVGTIRLPRAARIDVEVLAGGRPMAGQALMWGPDFDWDLALEHVQLLGTVDGRIDAHPYVNGHYGKTDAEGRHALVTYPGARGHVALVNGNGQVEETAGFHAAIAPASLRIELAEPLLIRVVRGGAPVAGVIVVGEATNRVAYRTDERGEVRMLRAHATGMRVHIRAPEAEAMEVDVPATATAAAPFVIELPLVTTATLRLEVLGDHRVRQIAASLQPLDNERTPTPLLKFRNDGEGPFTVDISPGRYRLRFARPNKCERRDGFVVNSTHDIEVLAGSCDVTVQVRHGGRISVDVFDDQNQRLPGRVELTGPDGAKTKPRFFSSEEGTTLGVLMRGGPSETWHNLLPGTYEVAIDLGARGIVKRSVEVRSCEVTEVVVRLP